MRPPLIILFAKAPVTGRVKTRLCPPLSLEEASYLHSALVQDTLEMLSTFSGTCDLELSVDSPTEAWPQPEVRRSVQSEGDLGTRLLHALKTGLNSEHEAAVVVGGDSPGLPASHIKALLESQTDITLGPTSDGGFFAICCRKVSPLLFEGTRWSSDQALQDVIAGAVRCGLTITSGPGWFDVDVEEDLMRMLAISELPSEAARWARQYRRRRESPR